MNILRPHRSRIALVLAVVWCWACNSIMGDKCTLIGCDSGLTVHLITKPEGTYKVEVMPDYPTQVPAYVYQCGTVTSCQQDIFFHGLIVDRAYVRVTTTTGTRTTEFKTVTYISSHPNGPNCGPDCRQATVNAEIPVT